MAELFVSDLARKLKVTNDYLDGNFDKLKAIEVESFSS